MTPLSPNPTPTEVHIRLLMLMGWYIRVYNNEEGEDSTTLYNVDGEPQTSQWGEADLIDFSADIPPLDDNLLRSARKRLLTTEEFKSQYAIELMCELGYTRPPDHDEEKLLFPTEVYSIISATVLTHATAICRAVEAIPPK